jgi:UTP--glucose-1-phosphate uridylyltransferase
MRNIKYMSIKKAVFVVAGFGTRFLPATKAQPKEMLPIVDKPIIQYLVEEAVAAGIEQIIFVTGRGKNSIENHFDKSYELEDVLDRKGKSDKLEEVAKIANLAEFAYVRQPVQMGDGHALLCAKPFLDPTESVLVIFPDYLMPRENKAISKIIEIYRDTHEPVICADTVPMEEVDKYGVLDFDETEDTSIVKVTRFVEKPSVSQAPSNLINAGYFVLTPEVLKNLEDSKSSVGDGEIRIADALISMVESGKPLYAYRPPKPGYDCGNILGFLKATVDFGLLRKDLEQDFRKFLKTKCD